MKFLQKVASSRLFLKSSFKISVKISISEAQVKVKFCGNARAKKLII